MGTERRKGIWLPLWISIGIAIGLFIGSKFSIFNTPGNLVGSGKLDAVLNYIHESYVDTVNTYQLVEDALPNIIQELDPHSEYISAADMKRVNESLEGHFSGIGVSFYVLRDTIVVTSIVPGGPSEAAGIMPWDRIVAVDDSVVAGKKIRNEQVLKVLRGERGTEVKLGIKRAGNDFIENITVTRGEIPVKSVNAAFMLSDEIGYIKLGVNFGFNTFSEFISAISKLKSMGANSFIIDLRGNAGGSLEVVVAMVNEFLQKGDLIVYTEGRNFPRTDNYANGSGTCKNDDVVVLIDELSASASEIFAGAIQDHDRGLVIGRRSFGKGLVQSQRNFPDGSAVRLTVARYYTASGRSIQRTYEKGRYDEYEMDAINRYIQGDYVNIDTLNNLIPYETLGGRTVYGGDGIMPDIFIPRDTTGYNSYYNSVVNRRLDEEYAMVYSDMNRERLSTFSTWQELYRYLRQQPLLLNLVSYADNNGIRRRPYYIQESGELFETNLYAYIIRNFFGEEAFWAAYYREDPLLNKGIELIETGMTKKVNILNEQFK
ncbi:MAG TPA: S41 family peptidase [Fermentimonas caenicola]|jgi:carboxyl-terminal processing protease|uniref:PDZ domain-containing protein n=1 Tax=Fermentimonas caenicola TaxID=1562970 RepID=A0A098C2Q3_9BACT|nr:MULTISPECIES: S41 family peptidase [Lascolabacillus]MBP6176381.1 S41 family peptidase [Fermentimonas sp.]MDI9625065.1 S41 family peptidase [Bacteroidota bacterium]TAH60219.1 MAG: S41 family peptidase [Fermentimonas caenicola]MBP6197610.1 S41 family peptidase [Fermentimonas sp.]MBP7105272.1 S41 family peptidase [Fermentimonas sp.]